VYVGFNFGFFLSVSYFLLSIQRLLLPQQIKDFLNFDFEVVSSLMEAYELHQLQLRGGDLHQQHRMPCAAKEFDDRFVQ